ncbi:MAG: DUF2304 domain-containing protein [Rudaea sp.]
MTVLIVSMVVGFALAGSILYLVRRDHLHGSYAVWWLAVAIVTLVLSIFPHIVDWLGATLGIAYPPILAIVIAMAFTLIRMLQMDIDRSRQERSLRRLTQRLAILDQELGEAREKLDALETQASVAGVASEQLRPDATPVRDIRR